MADYTLHCFLESGNAYKAALMLQLSGADWEPLWVDFFKGVSRTPEFRSLNEMGEIPVLIDHTEGDAVISQSGVILTHLAAKLDAFGANNPAEEREILRWILWDNHKFTGFIAAYRFRHHFMQKDGEVEAFLKARAFSAIELLDDHLEGRDWIATDRATIADLSVCGYLFWPDHFEANWSDYPNIDAWLGRIKSLKNWASPEDLLPSAPVAAASAAS